MARLNLVQGEFAHQLLPAVGSKLLANSLNS
jgi:hypothetical protein